MNEAKGVLKKFVDVFKEKEKEIKHKNKIITGLHKNIDAHE